MNRVEEGLDLSLKNLGLDYLDRAFFPVDYHSTTHWSYASSSFNPLASAPQPCREPTAHPDLT